MPLLVRRIQSIDNVNTLLRGGITASKHLDLREGQGSQYKLFGLDGLTLVFTSPPTAGTVTFSDPNGGGLDLKAIATAILSQTTTNGDPIRAKFSREGAQTRLILIEPAPAAGVALDATSTAAPVFGFDDGAIVGQIYGLPGAAAPSLVSLGDNDGSFTLVTNEP